MESTQPAWEVATLQPGYEPTEKKKLRGKRAVRNAIWIFILMMVVLTLLSNTLLNYSLPQVLVEKGAPGQLSHEVSGTGSIQPAEIVDYTADAKLTVDQVHVEVGDIVKVGQQLVTFRIADTANSLLDEQARYRQKQLSLEKLMDTYIDAQKTGVEKQIRDLSRDMESLKLDMQIQERKIATLQDQLKNGAAIVSTVNGVVTEINAAEGLTVNSGRSAVRVTNQEKGFQYTMWLDTEKTDYLTIGDEIEVLVRSLSNARIKGKLTELNDPVAGSSSGTGSTNLSAASSSASERKEVVIDVKDNRLKGGESAEIYFAKKMPQSRMLVSAQSVREDDQGKYVFVMKEKKGPLGNEFYVQKANVVISDTDDAKAAIESGVTPLDQVIASSSKSIEEGDRVVLAP